MTRSRIALALIAVVALLAVPWVVTDAYTRHLFIIAFIYAMIASNWDLSLGYSGLFRL